MSAELPDTSTLRTWEDAFQYPVPVVRGIEKKLKREAEDNQEKLRSLVGASYRDLLGTARTIVDIHGQVQTVEASLVAIGRRSDSRLLDKIAYNYTRAEKSDRQEGQARLTSESQLALLRSCLHATSHLLRARGSTLTCAKLLVVARLVHKVLATSTVNTALKTLSTRLVNARQKLLQLIDRRFTKLSVTHHDLVECMAAFALTTSSTPSDVLKHFLSIRLSAIRHSEVDQVAQVALTRRINLLLHTFRDIKACFPELVTTSLKLLGTNPLLEDEALLELDELRLDIHLRWLPDDLKNFTPYTRHDELNRTKTNDVLLHWSKQAYDALIVAAEHDTGAVSDLRAVLVIRQKVIASWLSAVRLARGTQWKETLGRLRKLFVQRSQSLIEHYAVNFRMSVSDAIISTVQTWSRESSNTSTETDLWSQALLSKDFGAGAADFRRSILERRTGSSGAVVRLVDALNTGRRQVEEIQEVLKAAKDIRWEYDEDDEDDDNDEDTPILALSKTDPMELSSTCNTAFTRSLAELEDRLQAQYHDNMPTFEAVNSPGPFLLRSLRELRYHVPRLLQDFSRVSRKELFCADLVKALQNRLAESITVPTEATFRVSLSAVFESRHNVQSLWIGSPPLPIQPTSTTIKYLRKLVKDMEVMGTDLWSADALGELKTVQQSSIAKCIDLKLSDLEELASKQQEQVSDHDGAPDAHDEDESDRIITTEVNGTNDSHEEESSRESAGRRESVLRILGIPDEDTAVVSNEDATENGTNHDQGQATQVASNGIDSKHNHNSNSAESTEKTRATPLPTQLTAKFVQLYFDVLYVDAALARHPTQSSDELPALQALALKLKEKTDLDEGAEARIAKSVSEYWRRTYLLFGLLVGH